MPTRILVIIKTKCKNADQIWLVVQKIKLEALGFIVDKTYEPKPLPNNHIAIRGFVNKKDVEKLKKLPRVNGVFNDTPLYSAYIPQKSFAPQIRFDRKKRIAEL